MKKYLNHTCGNLGIIIELIAKATQCRAVEFKIKALMQYTNKLKPAK